MAMAVRPLGVALGAEVTGLDLEAGLDAATVAALRRAFLEHHLLCFRAEPLPVRAFAALARHFGEPKPQLHEDLRHADEPVVW
jgi:alpha-ketoglutarate-dependent taurine dioxygenase